MLASLCGGRDGEEELQRRRGRPDWLAARRLSLASIPPALAFRKLLDVSFVITR